MTVTIQIRASVSDLRSEVVGWPVDEWPIIGEIHAFRAVLTHDESRKVLEGPVNLSRLALEKLTDAALSEVKARIMREYPAMISDAENLPHREPLRFTDGSSPSGV